MNLKERRMKRRGTRRALGIALMALAPVIWGLPPVETRTDAKRRGTVPTLEAVSPAVLTRVEALQQEIQDLRGALEEQTHLVKRLEQRITLLQSAAEKVEKKTLPVRQNVPYPVKPKAFSNGTKLYLPMQEREEESVLGDEEKGDGYGGGDKSGDAMTPDVRQNKQNKTKEQKAQKSQEVQNTPKNKLSLTTIAPVPAMHDESKPDHLEKVAREEELYEEAYAKIRHKQYLQAASAFQTFLKKFPSGQYAGYAHYWLGEVSLVQWQEGKTDAEWLEKAKQAFAHILSKFPDHPKARDALLKLGLIEVEKGNLESARNYFKDVKQRYPGTAAAGVAESQLKIVERS